MPLSEHEQRILEEIERALAQDDPDLAHRVSRSSLHGHLARRVRLAFLAFLLGFVMLLLFVVRLWLGVAGFVVMLLSGVVVYHYLRRMGIDQIQTWKRSGRFSMTGLLARLAERFRGQQGASS